MTDLRCSEVAPEARRNTLVIPFTALNTSVWSPESQPKSLRGHELLETLQTGTWWGLQRAQLLPSTWFQREFRAPEKSSRTPRHIFSHLKYSRPTPYRGRFSAEAEQVGIPPVSTKPCAWLPCSWTWGHPRCLREQMEREKGAYLWLLEGKSETVKWRHYRRRRGKSCQERRFSFCIQSDFLLSTGEVTGVFSVPATFAGMRK